MFHSIPARLTAICVTITVTAMLLLGLSTLWIMRSNMLSSLD